MQYSIIFSHSYNKPDLVSPFIIPFVFPPTDISWHGKEYVNKSFKDDIGNWIGSYHEVDYLNEEAVREALLSDVKKEIEESDSEVLNYKEEKDNLWGNNLK